MLLEGDNPLYPDVGNNAYRSAMTSMSASYDRIFALSVFTHFDRNMATEYFSSLAVKLSEDGMLLISAFVLTEFSNKNLAEGISNRSFTLEKDTLDDNGPLSAVSIELSFFVELALSNGLYLETFLTGNWSGFVSRAYQDVLVFRKPHSLPSNFHPGK